MIETIASYKLIGKMSKCITITKDPSTDQLSARVDYLSVAREYLPILPAAGSEDTQIVLYDCFAHFDLTRWICINLCSRLESLKVRPDVVMFAETKDIPFGCAVADKFAAATLLCRKGRKFYIPEVFEASTKTFSTEGGSTLYIPKKSLEGMGVLLVGDVYSTGATFRAMEDLVHQAGGTIIGKAAGVVEGLEGDTDVFHVLETPVFKKLHE